jgi:hypothetical protein
MKRSEWAAAGMLILMKESYILTILNEKLIYRFF